MPPTAKPLRPVLDLEAAERRYRGERAFKALSPESAGPAASSKAKRPKRGTMNKLETAYSRHLDWLKSRGEIKEWYFECVTLKLAENRCRYTPDFAVVLPHGRMDFHECKGYWRDDARVKIKVAAAKFPHSQFIGVQRIKGEWVYEDFSAR